ncbi:hypothetical protein [Sphingomonas solaris]|uniref:Uncharacterized protein n=1 Tax=Alterirhizorhabdus solaris TaxID=2529389 RepID=A0A558RCA3_9SPHN|nr:hypothetical protein [Sphingomonas solaris]TVV76971.1 hypothetical protein FOY91_02710 [Sphingomonas solaris]
MDDTIRLMVQIVPVIALVAFGVWYAFAPNAVASSHLPVARISRSIRVRPGILQESFVGFLERTWFVVPLVYGSLALLRWLAGEPDVAAGMIQRPPVAGTLYGYIAVAYLARDIWRVRKPLGALVTGRGGWASIKAAHAEAYAARSMPRPA